MATNSKKLQKHKITFFVRHSLLGKCIFFILYDHFLSPSPSLKLDVSNLIKYDITKEKPKNYTTGFTGCVVLIMTDRLTLTCIITAVPF